MAIWKFELSVKTNQNFIYFCRWLFCGGKRLLVDINQNLDYQILISALLRI